MTGQPGRDGDRSRQGARILESAQILEMRGRYLVSGGFDYVLKVLAWDVDHYREIMDDMVAAEVGVERFSSFISLQQIKQSRGFPLGLISANKPQIDREMRVIRRG
jgi:DNA-binding Lrp family transcriptional regulator